MPTLLDQELIVINSLLRQIREKNRTVMLCFSGLMLALPVSGALFFLFWLLGFHIHFSVENTLYLSLLFFGSLGVGCWSLWKRGKYFEELKERCHKVNAAGFVLYKRRAFLRDEIGASEAVPTETTLVLNVETLTHARLREIFL